MVVVGVIIMPHGRNVLQWPSIWCMRLVSILHPYVNSFNSRLGSDFDNNDTISVNELYCQPNYFTDNFAYWHCRKHAGLSIEEWREDDALSFSNSVKNIDKLLLTNSGLDYKIPKSELKNANLHKASQIFQFKIWTKMGIRASKKINGFSYFPDFSNCSLCE